MKQRSYRRWRLIACWLVVAGLITAMSWNVISLAFNLQGWWLGLVLPVPGLLTWVGLVITSVFLIGSGPSQRITYRLLYSSPQQWSDHQARQALLNLVQADTQLDLIWAKDGEEIGCWLSVVNHASVLERLVRDVFPGGDLETASLPEIGQGVVVLHWAKAPADTPSPLELCQHEGIDGVYFRWRNQQAATVVVWGPEAHHLALGLAQPDDFISGQGQVLLNPPFVGDNPWPELPVFPPSTRYPGLSAMAQFERLAPQLRPNSVSALVIGQDVDQQAIGFNLPDLEGLQCLHIVGQSTEPVVIDLVQQAVQAGQLLCLLDGQGVVTTRLARRLLREVATEKVLICDVERPAQSRFRINPLWLPDDAQIRQSVLVKGWLAWLRELGVTPGGLGQTAFWHTQIAVILTALVAVQRGLLLDVPGLRAALSAPDFLSLVREEVWAECDLLTDDIWAWWRTEGRQATNFDSHLRLAHLRDRLSALLDLPEYGVLWRDPYLNPLVALTGGQSLFWRLPDPRQRLAAYLNSQLLALNTLLMAWPPEQPPLLIILHELDAGAWLKRLQAFPAARLIVSTAYCRVNDWSEGMKPTSLIVSRLGGEDAQRLTLELPGTRANDLQRLPPQRLIFKRGSELCTVDMRPSNP